MVQQCEGSLETENPFVISDFHKEKRKLRPRTRAGHQPHMYARCRVGGIDGIIALHVKIIRLDLCQRLQPPNQLHEHAMVPDNHDRVLVPQPAFSDVAMPGPKTQEWRMPALRATVVVSNPAVREGEGEGEEMVGRGGQLEMSGQKKDGIGFGKVEKA